ncbi:hypothetical protein [Nocardioides lijunqiniae]|uniref:hypothetical protein n=1 Tax=Nocardioides lijunqiniae TaxID=2760832 RepID=UPI00187778D1|nr:hypothetical protein [Nocardioides lijunqiniae]
MQLTGAPTRSLVAVYQVRAGESRQRLAVGRVDARGRLVVRARARSATTFTAVFTGNASIDSATDTVPIRVRAAVTGRMTRFRSRAGRYAIYGARQTLWMVGRVSPNHAGDCLRFHLQFKVAGRWDRGSGTKCVRMSRSSRARVYLPGQPHLVGIPIRVRAEWAGDRVNLGRESDWQYARFSR